MLLVLGAALALAACGRKGELELPPAEPVLDDEPSGEAR
jgi:predicted small lipoprotein YifL